MAVGIPDSHIEWLKSHGIPLRVWTGAGLSDRLKVMAATSTSQNRRTGRRGLVAGALLAGLLMVASPAGADTYGNGEGNNTGQGTDQGSTTTTEVTTTTTQATTTTVGQGSNGSNGSPGNDAGTNSDNGNLAFTGTDAITLALIGAGATGAGVVLVASSRKRRHAEV